MPSFVFAELMVLTAQPPAIASNTPPHCEPNFFPLPMGSSYTTLVVFMNLISKLEGPRSAARL